MFWRRRQTVSSTTIAPADEDEINNNSFTVIPAEEDGVSDGAVNDNGNDTDDDEAQPLVVEDDLLELDTTTTTTPRTVALSTTTTTTTTTTSGEQAKGNDRINNPNEALFHILGRKFELFNDGDPFYINNADVISWKELQHCFMVLVWICTWTSSATAETTCSEAKSAPKVIPPHLPINIAAIASHSQQHHPQQSHVVMYIPIQVVYTLWEHIISISCPTLVVTNSNEDTTTKLCIRNEWNPSTQLALEFIQEALVSLGVLQIHNLQQYPHTTTTTTTLVRISQDIQYQFGMHLCETKYNDFIRTYQQHWHSLVIRAYQSWYFPSRINNDDDNICIDDTLWELMDKDHTSNTLFKVDGGYSLIMLPCHLTLSNSCFIETCQKLLGSRVFIQTRLSLMGIIPGTIQHLQDCERLYFNQKQLLKQQSDGLITLSTMEQSICASYTILFVQLQTYVSDNDFTTAVNVGRSMHLLATSLGEISKDYDQQLLIYTEALKLLQKTLGKDSIEVAETLHCIGFVKDSSRNATQSAMECYKESFRIKLIHHGREHPNVSKTVHNLGALYCEEGQYTLALAMFEETLRVRKQTLGPDDDAVADTLQWLANVYRELEMYPKALEYFNEALRIKKQTVGPDHLETGNVCHNLGIVFDDLGRHRMSIKCYKEALRIRKECLGNDDELVAETMHLMANVLLSKGSNKDALRHYEEALRIREHLFRLEQQQHQQLYGNSNISSSAMVDKLLECYVEALPLKKLVEGRKGSEEIANMMYRMAELYKVFKLDVDNAIEYFQAFVNLRSQINLRQDDDDQNRRVILTTSNALLSLGTLYEEKHDYERSVLYLEEALRAKRMVLGETGEVSDTLYLTGCVYNKLSDHPRAILYLKEALRIRKNAFANSSGDDLEVHIQHQIGIAHDALGEYDDAISSFSEALKLQEQQSKAVMNSSSSCDPKVTSDILRDMGHSYDAKKDLKMALESYSQASHIIQIKLGEQHEDLGDIYYSIGNVHAKLKQLDLAVKNFDASLQITNIHFEPTDQSLANILHNKGLVLTELGDSVQAKKMFEEALRIYKVNFQRGSVEVANTLHNIAVVCDKNKEFDEAARLYEESLKMKRQILGNDNLSVAQTLNNIGVVEAKREHFDVANVSLQESLRIKRHCLGESHQSVASTLHNIGTMYDANKEHEKAMLCFHEALRLRKSIFGNDSKEVATTLHSMGESYLKNSSQNGNNHLIAEAINCFGDAAEIRKQINGSNHTETAISLRELGMAYIRYNKEEEALPILEEYIRIYRLNESGERDMTTLEVFKTLTKFYISRKDDDKALRCLREANQLCEKHSDSIPVIVDSLFQIGSFFMRQGDYEKSLQYFTKAMHKRQDPSCTSKDDVCFGHILRAKGKVHQLMNEIDSALSSFEDCLRIYRVNSNKGDDDIRIADVLSRLGHIHAAQNDDEKAWLYGKEALVILKKKGENVDDILSLCEMLGPIAVQRQEFIQAKAFFNEAINIRIIARDQEDISLSNAFFQLGTTLDALAEISDAILAYKKSLNICEAIEGSDITYTAAIFARLGCAHAKVKEYNEALSCLSKALSIHELNGDEQSLDIADILSNMGGIYDARGEFENAFNFYKDSMSAYEVALGSNHLRVSDVLVRIGAYHARRKEYGSAIDCYKRALIVKKEHLGSDDLAVAKTLRCMADILSDIGQNETGLELYKEVLRINKLYEEVSNLERGKILIKMAEACNKSTLKKDEAVEYYLEAMRLYRLDIGDDNLEFSSMLLSVGEIYASKSDWDNAIKCFTKSLAIRMVILPNDDPAIAQLLTELGKVQQITGRFDDAITSFEDSLKILRSNVVVEDNNELTGMLLLHLGELFSKKKKFNKAIDYYTEAWNLLSADVGNNIAGKASFALGVIFFEQTDYDQSIFYLKEAFGRLKTAHGSESIEVTNVLFYLGSALASKHDYKSAKICLAECLQKRLALMKSDDVAIAQVSKSLGALYLLANEHADSLKHMEIANTIYRKRSGKKSIEVADIAVALANAYAAQGDDCKADTYFKEALGLYKALPNDSCEEQISDLLNRMGQYYSSRKMYNEAIEYLKEALRCKKRLYGNDHRAVAELAEQIADVLIVDGVSQYDAAVKCYMEAKRIYDKVDDDTTDPPNLNLKSPSIVSKLGDVYAKRGDKEKAVDFYIESLHLYQLVVGEDSIESSAIYHKLGNIYHEVKEYDMSMDSFRRCLVTRKMRLGDDNIEVAITLRDKGAVHESRREVDEAINCYEESFRIYKMNIISDDDSVMQLLNRAGFLAINFSTKNTKREKNLEIIDFEDNDEMYDREIFIDKAAKFFNDALLIGKSIKKSENTSAEILSETYYGLGLVHSEKASTGAALECFQASLKIRQSVFGNFHPKVAATWFSLGSSYSREGDFKESLKCFDEALKIRKKLIHANSTAEDFADVGTTLYKIGTTLKSLGLYEKSLRCLEQCLQVREAKLGKGQTDVAKTLNHLGVVASKLGEYALAANYWHRSIQAYKTSVNMEESNRIIQSIRGNIEMAERLS